MDKTRSKKNSEFAGKVVIVTGGAKGIGRGIAKEFGDHGAKVVIADIDKESSQKTTEQLTSMGLEVVNMPTDVSDYAENKKLTEAILEQFGGVDILVNNAGINIEEYGIVEDRSRDKDRSVFETNLIGPYFLTQMVARAMSKKGEGNMLFISSIHSHVTQLHPAYSATKAAIEMLVKELALELSEHNIRVNAIAPGAISIRGDVDPKKTSVPLGHSGMPKDIADTTLFLTSEKARYITGQTIVVDGGLSLTHNFWGEFKKRKS